MGFWGGGARAHIELYGDQANNEHNCDIELLISDGKRVDCVWCVLVLDSMAY